MCIRDSSSPGVGDDDVTGSGSVMNRDGDAGTNSAAPGFNPVSYTHLDVYKRQKYILAISFKNLQ